MQGVWRAINNKNCGNASNNELLLMAFKELKRIHVSHEKTTVDLPILIQEISENGSNSVIARCPYFQREYKLSGLISSDKTTNNDGQLSLSELIELMHQQLQEVYDRDGYLEHPEDINSVKSRHPTADGYWMSLKLEIMIKRKCCERALPKIAIVSAVASQVLLLVSASISIYVKGVSAPVTLLIVSATGISTLINFTQSGTSEAVSKIGAYLDYKPMKKIKNQCNQLSHKVLWFSAGTVTLGIWGITLVGNSISAFSETEIIDKAGNEAGLTFLTPSVIFVHAVALTVFGGITSGLFGGNFAYKALTHFYGWVAQKCYGNNEPNYGDEARPLFSTEL